MYVPPVKALSSEFEIKGLKTGLICNRFGGTGAMICIIVCNELVELPPAPASNRFPSKTELLMVKGVVRAK